MATRATPKKLVLLPIKPKPKVLRKRTGRARGRPPVDLDVKTAARVAGLGATIDEIAAVLGCGHALIYKRMNSDPVFREAIEEGRAFGRVSLRRMQWQTAQAGNATMQIWLGKQMLGQRDFVALDEIAAPISADSGDKKFKFTLKIARPAPKDDDTGGEDDGSSE